MILMNGLSYVRASEWVKSNLLQSYGFVDHPESPHKDKPRIMKVSLSSEMELENILLSAYLLRDGKDTTSRIFPDIPWSERSERSSKIASGVHSPRSLILLGVPDNTTEPTGQTDNAHDAQQWCYIRETLGINDVAVIDTYRIPKSTNYAGSGPRPLKLTFLTKNMSEVVRTRWSTHQSLLPRELKLYPPPSPKPKNTAQHDKNMTSDIPTEYNTKNDVHPTPLESGV